MKIKKVIKSKRHLIIFSILIFSFPFVLGCLYPIIAIDFAIDANELLKYFATAFGIFASFATYRHEINKQKKLKRHDLQPDVFVDVKTKPDNAQVYIVSIYNHSNYPIKEYFIFEIYVKEPMQNYRDYKICFNKTDDEFEKLKEKEGNLINVCCDENIMDIDGLPKYILINCDDNENNMWNCIFEKKDIQQKKYYIPYYELI